MREYQYLEALFGEHLVTSPSWYSLGGSECVRCQHTNSVTRLQVCDILRDSFYDATELNGSSSLPGLDFTRENVDVLDHGSAFAHSITSDFDSYLCIETDSFHVYVNQVVWKLYLGL